MSLKEKVKKSILSTVFNGTYKEYTQLKEKENLYNIYRQKDKKENNILNKKIEELQLEAEKLKNDLENKQKEITRVYEGHQGLEDEINFLKYRNETLINLHDETVEKYWNEDNRLKDYICLRPFESIEILPRG